MEDETELLTLVLGETELETELETEDDTDELTDVEGETELETELETDDDAEPAAAGLIETTALLKSPTPEPPAFVHAIVCGDAATGP
jgi:hypothetical protein